MIWYICFAVSLFFSAASIIWAVILGVTKRGGKIFKPFNVLFAGVLLSIFTLQLPIITESTADCPWWLKTVFLTLHGTLQTLSVDSDREMIIKNVNTDIVWVYSAYMSFLFIASPIMFAGYLLSLFKTVSANFRYTLNFFNPVYAFSELNERSVALGRSLKANYEKAQHEKAHQEKAQHEKAQHEKEQKRPPVLVYADTENDAIADRDELIEQARKLGAILTKKEIGAIPLKRHSKKAPITLFAIGDDELKNVSNSLTLVEAYKDRPGTRLYVFSTRKESELLFTSASTNCLKVRRVNEVRSLVCRMLNENGVSLFKNAKALEDGTKLIHAVIVGLGRHGTEMLKALTWYCQMEGYRIVIDAFDMDKLAEEKLCALCPELMSPKYNGVHVDGETEYLIRVHSGVDVYTKTFADEIYKLTDATYAFVCLGADEKNIDTAATLRMYFERMRIHPDIDSVVYNTAGKKALTGVKNYRGQEYCINFIGDMETSYSEDAILNSTLEKEALARHKKWSNEKEEEFWAYEYNYNSSMATAIHMKARIACGVPGAGKPVEELTDEERDALERLEHRRWNAYMRAEGYIFSGSKDKSSRNDLGRMHHDLVSFEELSKQEKEKDSSVGSK